MLDQTKLKFYRFLSAILLVALLSMSGVIYVSAHGGDVTLIHACVTNRTGAVRVVSPTTACDANRETVLDWSIQGPKGVKGDTGDVGPMGPQGAAGTGLRTYWRSSDWVEFPAGQYGNWVDVYCDPGDEVITGGFRTSNSSIYVESSTPEIFVYGFMGLPGTVGWRVSFNNTGLSANSAMAMAICADTAP